MFFSSIDKARIYHLLEGKEHLIPVFTNVTNIPERIKEYDPELFVVFNKKNQRYEIHARDSGETSYNCTIPYKDLDERALRYIRKNDIRVHGDKIFKRINQSEINYEERLKRDEKNFTIDFAKEFQSEFAKDAW